MLEIHRTRGLNAVYHEYIILFNAIEDAERELTDLRARLIRAQQEAEEEYVCTEPETADTPCG